MNMLAYYPLFAHPLLLIVVVLLLILLLPHWPYSQRYVGGVGWGWSPIGLILIILLIVILLGGCATQTIPGDRASQVRQFITNIEPGLRPGATLACSIAFLAVHDDQAKADFKKQSVKISAIVAAVTPDQTPGMLSKSIQAMLPATPDNKQMADAIAGGYGVALPFIRDDTRLFVKVVSDLAAGVNDFAQQ